MDGGMGNYYFLKFDMRHGDPPSRAPVATGPYIMTLLERTFYTFPICSVGLEISAIRTFFVKSHLKRPTLLETFLPTPLT